MSAIPYGYSEPALTRRPRFAVPWIAAIIVLVLFAMADWSWTASERWEAREKGTGSELAGKISEGSAARQTGFILIGLMGISLLAIPSNRTVRLNLIVAYPIVLFVIWALISVTWSEDRALTMKRLTIFVAMIFLIAGSLKHYDIRQLAWIALIGSVMTSVVGGLVELAYIHGEDLSDWRFGGMMHPNHAGMNCCVSILASLYLFRIERKRRFLIICALSFLVLFLTKSRTALIAGMTGVAIFLVLSTAVSRVGWAVLLAAWFGAGALWLSSLDMLPNVADVVSLGRADIKDADVTKLTGRTDIWHYAIANANHDPNRTFIGYGYESFWTPEHAEGISQFLHFPISEGHCIYLDWYLELGVIGSGLFILALLTGIVRWTIAARYLKSPAAALAAAALCATVVHGLAESALGDPSLPTFFVYTAIAGAALMRPDELENA